MTTTAMQPKTTAERSEQLERIRNYDHQAAVRQAGLFAEAVQARVSARACAALGVRPVGGNGKRAIAEMRATLRGLEPWARAAMVNNVRMFFHARRAAAQRPVSILATAQLARALGVPLPVETRAKLDAVDRGECLRRAARERAAARASAAEPDLRRQFAEAIPVPDRVSGLVLPGRGEVKAVPAPREVVHLVMRGRAPLLEPPHFTPEDVQGRREYMADQVAEEKFHTEAVG